MKQLHRSSRHKILFGVCGGLAEYLGVSVALVRVLVLALAFVGSGIVLYIAGMIIMPVESTDATTGVPATPAPSSAGSFTAGIGVVLVVIGSLWMLDRLEIFELHQFWHTIRNVFVPMAIILFGIAILMRRGRGDATTAEASGVPQQPHLPGGQWHRARSDRKFFGVCAGIAHAMNVDPTVIRLAWVLMSLHSLGVGLVVYLILALVLPEEQVATTI